MEKINGFQHWWKSENAYTKTILKVIALDSRAKKGEVSWELVIDALQQLDGKLVLLRENYFFGVLLPFLSISVSVVSNFRTRKME